MPLPNHREAFIDLLGRECEECGEKRPATLSLAPRSALEERKINLLMRESEVDLEALRGDFRLLCLNCKADWEANSPSIQEKRKESVKRGRERWLEKRKGRVVNSPKNEEEMPQREDFIGSFNVKPKPRSQNDEEQISKYMELLKIPSLKTSAKSRLKFDFGIDVDNP